MSIHLSGDDFICQDDLCKNMIFYITPHGRLTTITKNES